MTLKILCLGNNTVDTDTKTKAISDSNNQPCHGLLSEINGPIVESDYALPGYYHSSVYDIEFGRLIELCSHFDQIIMLDQPKSNWTHPDAFYQTVRVLNTISTSVLFLDPTYQDSISFFENLVHKNKSFCIFPFIEMLVNFNYTTVCCRSTKPVSYIDNFKSFDKDTNYNLIRNNMLKGVLLPEYCSSCYRLENKGIVSARIQETVEWANRLSLNSLDDLKNITNPVYYEVRSDNKCNLQCRTCKPEDSHLIEKEYKKIGIPIVKNRVKKNNTGFNIVNFDHLKKLYVAGGEPTLIAEFYQFIDFCIEQKYTDFEFLVNTNGTKLNNRFKNQLKHFSNFQFVFSIDGLDQLNYYIRWPAKWNNIVDNFAYLVKNNHKVTVNTTVSIYNVASLDQLFEFVDQKFPNTLIHCQLVGSPNFMSPFIYPYPNKAIASLSRIKNFNCYKNDPLLASSVDGLINHFDTMPAPNNQLLKKFFVFNDQLDQSRQISLKEYLPELDYYRNFIV